LNGNGLVQRKEPELVDACGVVVGFEGLAVCVQQHVVEHAARLEDVVEFRGTTIRVGHPQLGELKDSEALFQDAEDTLNIFA
jgi:hypothetical protein